MTRGTQTVTLTKVPGSGDNAAEKWQVAVSGDDAFGARDADAGKVEDLLSKLSGLRAASFADKAPAATTPAIKVAARFDENSREEAGIARQGSTVVATRADEAGVAMLEAPAFDEALKALDAVIAPPAPAAPATPPAAAAPEKKP